MFNNYRMLKLRVEKFSYNSFCTKIFQDEILPELLEEVLEMRVWRSLEETVVFADTCIPGDMAGSYRRGAGV